jgi:ABC-2 type transport system ATP-binding protein
MAGVAVRHLRVVRGGAVVLSDLSFDITAGTVTGLLGPSGSGKSTLIRAIVGVQIVAGGRIEVLGAAAGAPRCGDASRT